MTILTGDSVTELFTDAVKLAIHGQRVSPRGMATREVLDVDLALSRPQARLLLASPARVLNVAFAVAETVWILSGSDDEWIYDYNGQLRKYADDGRLRGAYGPRMRRWGGHLDQLAQVLALLKADPDSRRAVIQLYDPARDSAGHRDVPCTLGFRFHLRQKRLHMSTTMRSQDLWTGMPYDLFFTTTLHELMAGWLGVELGTYRHHVDSLHLYEDDLERAEAVTSVAGSGDELPELAVPWEGFDALLAAVQGGAVSGHAGWDAMANVLSSYRLWKAGERVTAQHVADQVCGPLGVGLRAWYEELRVRAGRPAAAR
ncbi:thymidylate synthase [Sphaerisporangium sp. NPDC088356]|uniref:thymidylate synthase n=1 Tax=Sphaerisporangium sp. NPDC088356 TaxID=3154871 RepID=UPI0034152D98